MSDEYRRDSDFSKKIEARKCKGLPAHIKLKFNICYIRFYKSENIPHTFYCQLAIPRFKDDDGYVLELFFDDSSKQEEPPIQNYRDDKTVYDPEEDAMINVSEDEPEADYGHGDEYYYTVLDNGMSFDELARSSKLFFKLEVDGYGRNYLRLNLEIKPIAYYGDALIDSADGLF